MKTQRRHRNGFTLIELMITVAIIGILSATAIAGFQTYQFRTKRSEAMTNVEAIAKMEKGYFGEYGLYTAIVPMPGGAPNSYKRVWDAATEAAFSTLGFKAEGGVYYTYEVGTSLLAACGCPNQTCFTNSAWGDLDGDGAVAEVGHFHPDVAGNTCNTLTSAQPVPVVAGNPQLDRPVLMPLPMDDF